MVSNMTSYNRLAILIVATALSACDRPSSPPAAPPPELAIAKQDLDRFKKENEQLKEQVESLKRQVAELSLTPQAMLAAVSNAVSTGNLAEAVQASDKLNKRFPSTPEAKAASDTVAKAQAQEREREEQEKRIAALGFYAIKPMTRPSFGKMALRVESITTSNRFIFDANGSQYMYRDSERGERFVVLKATASSEDKSSDLPFVGVYKVDGKVLKYLQAFSYEFRKWSSYGTYIGLYHDFKNDFAYTKDVQFTAAASISDDDAKAPLAIVILNQLCFQRKKRTGRPEVEYRQASCNPPQEIGVDDFGAGKAAILSFLNKPKGT